MLPGLSKEMPREKGLHRCARDVQNDDTALFLVARTENKAMSINIRKDKL